MTENTLSEQLRLLATNNMQRSKSARLREVLDDVEWALAAGVSKSLIIEQLAKNNLPFTLTTFNTTLQRLRKKRAISSIKSSATSAVMQPDVDSLFDQSELDTVISDSHNPVALDNILGSKPDLAALAKLAKRIKK